MEDVTIISEFQFADVATGRRDTSTDLPQRSELPLLDAQELGAFTGDDGGVSGGVVQDGLSKGCSSPQCANNNSILKQKQNGGMTPFQKASSNTLSLL